MATDLKESDEGQMGSFKEEERGWRNVIMLYSQKLTSLNIIINLQNLYILTHWKSHCAIFHYFPSE